MKPKMVLLASWIIIVCYNVFSQMQVVKTSYETDSNWQGLGEEYFHIMDKANTFVIKGRLRSAARRYIKILGKIESLMNDTNVMYFSVGVDSAFLLLKGSYPDNKVVRISAVYEHSLKHLGFIYVEKREFFKAINILEKQITYNPYSIAAYCEVGHIYNRLKEFNKAREIYEKGVQYAMQFVPSSKIHAMALRGLGYAQIELGLLEIAKKTYLKSLEIDPKSKVALEELEYIDKKLSEKEIEK